MLSRRTGLSFALAAAVSGCGFQLRQAPQFAFQTLYIHAPTQSALSNELRRSIASAGTVQLLAGPGQMEKAQVVLDVISEQREKVVVGLNASGQVREFQLRVRFKFKLRAPQDRELIAATELMQQRDFSFNETAVLAKEGEEAVLYREMQSDIVQQVMRRLAAVKSL